MEATPWDNELATRIVTAMVHGSPSKPSKFMEVAELLSENPKDVIAAGLAGSLRQWSKYDPSKSQPQTFIQQRAHSAAWDYLRKSGSMQRADRANGSEKLKDKRRDLCDRVQETYEAAKRVYTAKRYRQGRKFYNIAQLVALASLMEEKKLTCRGCAEFLAGRDDIMSAIRIRRIPSHMFFHRAMVALRAFHARNVVTESDQNQSDVVTENRGIRADVVTENQHNFSASSDYSIAV